MFVVIITIPYIDYTHHIGIIFVYLIAYIHGFFLFYL